jgi:hypothetical protein
MITITRRQARHLRGLFRRAALGIAHRGVLPPLVLRAEADRLRVQHRYAALAVAYAEPGNFRPVEAIAVPLDALSEFEGRDDSPVVFEAADSGGTVVRWDDSGIPQTREYDVPALDSLAAFPEPPVDFQPAPAGLLEALAAAAATGTADSTRYALDCVQLRDAGRGQGHEIVATDGRQLLVQSGFRLPWTGDALVKGTPTFASPALARDRSLEIGRSDAHVVLRAGSWTLFLEVQTDVRFPDVTRALPVPGGAATRLRLDPDDACFLVRALERLPGADELNAPVTVDLNGQVAVRARSTEQTQVTELVLARSQATGPALRLNTNRDYLARALRLGFTEVELVDADTAAVCHDRERIYAWQPLSKAAALEPGDDVLRIESKPVVALPPRQNDRTRATASARNGKAPRAGAHEPIGHGSAATADGHDSQTAQITNRSADVRRRKGDRRPSTQAGAQGKGLEGLSLSELIGEAVALHAALGEARQRARGLAAALRRHRRQERLVNNTLATLKQIRLPEIRA